MAEPTTESKLGEENYQPLLRIGVLLVILIFLGTSVYWFSDQARLNAAAQDLNQGRVERGQETYSAQCTVCHGEQGEGGVGPTLNNRTLLKNTPDEIFFSVIRSGVPNTRMPSWSVDFGGPLTDETIRDVVSFLRSWEATAPEIKPEEQTADPSRGAVLFESTCAICHGKEGQGGKPGIPALNDPERLSKLDNNWYRDVIANGRPAKGMPTWGTVLSPKQLDDLVALISAWRNGQQISPAFSVTDLISGAIYALSQNDPDSAEIEIERALNLTSGAAAEVLLNAQAQLNAGDQTGARATLKALQSQWPLGDANAGAVVYNTQCAPCHGSQGEGGIGKPLHPSTFIQSQKNEQLIEFIKTGRPGTAMAGFEGRLSETQIADVIAFLRSWQK